MILFTLKNNPSTSGSVPVTTNTVNTTIFQHDGPWANAVRSIFIYGAGTHRYYLLRSGTPGSRLFVLVSTVASDAAARVVNNSINDPSFIRNHYISWRAMWQDMTTGSVRLDMENGELLHITRDSGNHFIQGGDNLNNLVEMYLKDILYSLKYILKPVQVDCSNSMLSDQISGLSIVLFILAVVIIGLIVVLLLNIFFY